MGGLSAAAYLHVDAAAPLPAAADAFTRTDGAVMKIIYLVTEDNYFYSHRLPMARAAKAAGFDDVVVITNVKNHRGLIEKEGIRVIPLSLDRRSLNPFRAAGHIFRLWIIYRREKPDIVHHIAMKPVLYGSIAALAAGIKRIINAFAGLGYVFTSQDFRARFLRIILMPDFMLLLRRRNSYLLLQNEDDLALLRRLRMVPEGRVRVIRGSGVDTASCHPLPSPASTQEFICVYAGRMIGIKGLDTLKGAFEILALRAPHARLWLCGDPDPANPGSWSEEQLKEWERQSGGRVVYKGHCADMSAIWAQAHVAVQASCGGEGVPKSLLEAAAYARPIIATDVPGNREVVKDGRNGFLVKPRDAEALAAAIEKVALLPDGKRTAMGHESRILIENSDMTAACVSAESEKLYREVLGSL